MQVKALLVFAASVCALSGCSGGGDDLRRDVDEAVAADVEGSSLAAIEPVRLVKAFSAAVAGADGGGFVRSFLVRSDASLGKKKAVFIHHSAGPREAWVDYPAELVRTTGNVDYWFVRLGGTSGAASIAGNEFVVKYVADERTWWDNNGRSNYSLGPADGPFLALDHQVLLDSASVAITDDAYTVALSVDVRNLAFKKAVTVLYSTDGWTTAKAVPATYRAGYRVASGTLIPSPNRFGIEPWFATIAEVGAPQTLELAVKFETEKGSFWDNNDGQNYVVAFENGQGRLVNAKWIP